MKSMFQTAAFAGFPHGSFMVQSISESGPSTIARLVADAQVPVPPRAEEERVPEQVLHVVVANEKFVLVWKSADVLATVDIPRTKVLTRAGESNALRFPELASKDRERMERAR